MTINLNSQVVSQELGADSDAPKLVLARLSEIKVFNKEEKESKCVVLDF